MTDGDNNLPAVAEEKTDLPASLTDDASSELKDSLTEDLIEMFLPKIVDKLEPAYEKLAEFLGKDEKRLMVQVNPRDGSVHLMVIKTEAISEMVVDEEIEEAITDYPIGEFLKIIMSGNIEELMKIAKEETEKK